MFTTPFAFMAAAGGTLLLDIYTGAKRAYSVRRLSSSYTGNALRVRRSSDNAEQDIGFVGENLDTSALTTFCSGTDGFVTTWYDQSGNAENATQSTSATQSQIVSSGTIYTVGTKSAIYASSGRSRMNFTEFTTTLTTQVLVGKKASSTSNALNAFSGPSDPTGPVLLSHYTDSNIYFQWQGYYSAPTSAISNIDYEVIFATTLTASTSEIRRNGSSLSLNNFSTNIKNRYSTIFVYNETQVESTAYFQELIVWDSGQSSNASGIETNINTYYSIY